MKIFTWSDKCSQSFPLDDDDTIFPIIGEHIRECGYWNPPDDDKTVFLEAY